MLTTRVKKAAKVASGERSTTAAPPRPRGRPPAKTSPDAAPPRPRGRPRKAAATLTVETVHSLPAVATLAVETAQSLPAAAAKAAGAAVKQVQQLLAPAAVQAQPTLAELDSDSFYNFLRDAGSRLVVVDFYTTWCGPCKVIEPQYKRMAGEYDSRGVVFTKFNCHSDDNKELIRTLGVKALPTFHVYHKGHHVGEFVGAQAPGLRQMLESCMGLQRA